MLAAFIAGYFARTCVHPTPKTTALVELRQGGYRYTSPLLECDSRYDDIPFLRPFKDKTLPLIQKMKDEKVIDHVSIYFRDLTNGPTFFINEDEKFAPASLLKVPTVMALLKQAESDPALLNKKIKYNGDDDFNLTEYFKPSEVLTPGSYYTLDDLAHRALVHSDNNANKLIFENIDQKILKQTYHDLVVEIPTSYKPENFMTVKEYASFFRVLFNATYLSKAMSEKALKYLAEKDFDSGISAGVPSNVPTALKFGERTNGPNNNVRQLHDCGIVYYPGRPYLLCIMTRGQSFEKQGDAIRNISHLIYTEIDSQARK